MAELTQWLHDRIKDRRLSLDEAGVRELLEQAAALERKAAAVELVAVAGQREVE